MITSASHKQKYFAFSKFRQKFNALQWFFFFLNKLCQGSSDGMLVNAECFFSWRFIGVCKNGYTLQLQKVSSIVIAWAVFIYCTSLPPKNGMVVGHKLYGNLSQYLQDNICVFTWVLSFLLSGLSRAHFLIRALSVCD